MVRDGWRSETWNNESDVSLKSLHVSRSCDLVKQQTFLLSQHEREEGKRSIKTRP